MWQRATDAVFLGGFSLLYSMAVSVLKHRKGDTRIALDAITTDSLPQDDRSGKGFPVINVLTIDVEEYFHPTEIQQVVPVNEWESLSSRVEREVLELLDLFDTHQVKATFFILGWVAPAAAASGPANRRPGPRDRLPQLRSFPRVSPHAGAVPPRHEPGGRHDSGRQRGNAEGVPGGRATRSRGSRCGPSRSSWNPGLCSTRASTPSRTTATAYPAPSGMRTSCTPPSGPIQEIPIATVELAKGRIAPIGGGGYLRMLPYRYTAAGIRRMNRDEQSQACIYFHPWELDPHQPRLTSALVPRLRTYTGLRGMRSKVERLITDFQFSTLTAVHGRPELVMTAGRPVFSGR